MSMNSGFWDLDGDERAAIYDRAASETGVESFWDLTAEERGHYYELGET